MFSSRAQAGLEYLMTYSLALIMIVSIIGALLFAPKTLLNHFLP